MIKSMSNAKIYVNINMDFINLYNQFKSTKITDQFTKKYSIERIMVGSGGSEDIIVHFKRKKTNLIAKIFLHHSGDDRTMFEIKILQFLVKRFLLTNRTPHLVGLYNHQRFTNLSHFLNYTIKLKSKCMSYEDKLIKKSQQSYLDSMICDLREKSNQGLISNSVDLVLLEYCENNLGYVIRDYMYELHQKPSKGLLDEFVYQLYRLLFQLIFTLAIIQDDYPGFCHDDFFCRNILIKIENAYDDLDYVEYRYLNQRFYLPANGLYAKISDFGMSVIVGQVDTDRYNKSTQKWQRYYHQNPFNHKIDIFNLLHDIYY